MYQLEFIALIHSFSFFWRSGYFFLVACDDAQFFVVYFLVSALTVLCSVLAAFSWDCSAYLTNIWLRVTSLKLRFTLALVLTLFSRRRSVCLQWFLDVAISERFVGPDQACNYCISRNYEKGIFCLLFVLAVIMHNTLPILGPCCGWMLNIV